MICQDRPNPAERSAAVSSCINNPLHTPLDPASLLCLVRAWQGLQPSHDSCPSVPCAGLAGLAAFTAQVQRQSPAVSPFATFGESSDNHMPDFELPRGTVVPRRAAPAPPAGEPAAGQAAAAAAAAQLLTSGAGWRASAQGNVAGVDGPAGRQEVPFHAELLWGRSACLLAGSQPGGRGFHSM